MKKFTIFTFILSLFFFQNLNSMEVKTIATVNNIPISNIDLIYEIKTKEILNSNKINKDQYGYIIQEIINNRIKELETNKLNITFNKAEANTRLESILKKIPSNSKIDSGIKNNMKKTIETSLKWNNLIINKYKNKLEININEIDEIAKAKTLTEEEKNRLINFEKTKKLNVISKTYFNEIKRNYYVNILR